MIELHNYRIADPGDYGLEKQILVYSFHYEYQDSKHLVELELDLSNHLIITVYELDEDTKLYIGDTGENILLVFEKLIVDKNELQDYVTKWIEQNKKVIFDENVHYVNPVNFTV